MTMHIISSQETSTAECNLTGIGVGSAVTSFIGHRLSSSGGSICGHIRRIATYVCMHGGLKKAITGSSFQFIMVLSSIPTYSSICGTWDRYGYYVNADVCGCGWLAAHIDMMLSWIYILMSKTRWVIIRE